MFPFKKYIISEFFIGKTGQKILNNLMSYEFHVESHEIIDCINEYKLILSPVIKELLKEGSPLNPENKEVIPWLKYFKIEEYYNYMFNNGVNEEYTPLYYKWCRDAIWIAENENVRSIVNIFLFNKEEYQSIERIVKFRYNRKISQKALKLYHDIFWNCDSCTAREAIERYKPFQNTALIIKRVESSYSPNLCSVESYSDSNNDSVKNILERDSNWIKWKMGIKSIEAPTPKNFLNKIKLDSSMLYDEIMSTREVQEVKVIENKIKITKNSDGDVESELYDEKEITHKDLNEYKLSNAKKCVDLFIKAEDHMPKDGSNSTKKFFDHLKSVELKYTADYDAKIVSLENNPEALEDFLKATGGGEEGEV